VSSAPLQSMGMSTVLAYACAGCRHYCGCRKLLSCDPCKRKANDIDRAQAWFHRMVDAGVEADTVTYNTVINACARVGDAEQAEDWMRHMVENGVSPGQLTFNSMLNACAQAGDIPRCEKWLSKMRGHGLGPDGVSFGTVIHGCVKAQKMSRAEQLLQEMLTSDQSCGDSSNFCFSLVVQGLARAGNAQRASYWLQVALDTKVEVSSKMFIPVIGACIKAGDLEDAQTFMSQMASAGIPLPRVGTAAPETLARAWMQQGLPHRASAVRQLAARPSRPLLPGKCGAQQ